MSGKRQKTQDSLALAPNGRGETRAVGPLRAEPLMAKPAPESAAVTERIMEEVCDRENLQSAWKRVQRNQGSPGVDGMSIVDRLIQQAVLQVLQEQWDPTFSEHSYGFRPGRSAHKAVAQAQRYVAEGYNILVDLDRWFQCLEPPAQAR
jgi:RNA-directed DNA polymerase